MRICAHTLYGSGYTVHDASPLVSARLLCHHWPVAGSDANLPPGGQLTALAQGPGKVLIRVVGLFRFFTLGF